MAARLGADGNGTLLRGGRCLGRGVLYRATCGSAIFLPRLCALERIEGHEPPRSAKVACARALLTYPESVYAQTAWATPLYGNPDTLLRT